MQNNYFSHEDRSGGQPWDRAEKAGYTTGFVGENISAGYASPFDAITGWMKSSGHCANILKATHKDIGIGVATRAESEFGIYWTMVLGGNDASAQGAAKIKLTSVKRRKDGKYSVQGKVASITTATVVSEDEENGIVRAHRTGTRRIKQGRSFRKALGALAFRARAARANWRHDDLRPPHRH